jgi:cytochrome c-type biogenesis protein CcmH
MKTLFLTRALFLTLFLTLALALSAVVAHAVEPRERLSDPVLEARARVISGELRCLVCQNESIDESGADLAHDIRMLVRERLVAGDTNVQTIQAVVNRYGSFVLLKPPVEPATYFLWFGPPVLVALGLVGTAFWLRRRTMTPVTVAPLSAEERRRLDSLLRDNEG